MYNFIYVRFSCLLSDMLLKLEKNQNDYFFVIYVYVLLYGLKNKNYFFCLFDDRYIIKMYQIMKNQENL